MPSTTQSSMRVVSPDETSTLSEAQNEDMTEKSAAELRELCDKKGEPFDIARSEAQAQERIAALKDMD